MGSVAYSGHSFGVNVSIPDVYGYSLRFLLVFFSEFAPIFIEDFAPNFSEDFAPVFAHDSAAAFIFALFLTHLAFGLSG